MVRKLGMGDVSLAAAKAHLSELVERAAAGDPIRITRRGKPVAQLLPIREADRRSQARQVREVFARLARARFDMDSTADIKTLAREGLD